MRSFLVLLSALGPSASPLSSRAVGPSSASAYTSSPPAPARRTTAFVPARGRSFRRPSAHAASPSVGDAPAPPGDGTACLLLSSFTDGVVRSAQGSSTFLRALRQILDAREAEEALAESARASPCAGPDPVLLGRVLDGDVAGGPAPRRVRMVYVPTARYALRVGSENTPGKQRQRARADGRSRRRIMERYVYDALAADGAGCEVRAITVDLDDGSAKQPACLTAEGDACQGGKNPVADGFPEDGHAALKSWNPHLIVVDGGNTFWLHRCLVARSDKRDGVGSWTSAFSSACSGPSGALYVGISAGAILAGKHVETACWKRWDDPRVVPGMESYADWKGVEGMGFAMDNSIFPHMDDEWEDTVNAERLQVQSDVVALRESDGLFIDGRGGMYSYIGNDNAEPNACVES